MKYLSQVAKNYPASGIRKMFDLKLTVGEQKPFC